MQLCPIRVACSQDTGEINDDALPELLSFLGLSRLAESYG